MFDIETEKRKFYDLIGVIHEVHKHLGPGLNESCYQEAMELQLKDAAIPYKREMTFHPTYKGVPLQATFRIDFLCQNDVIVECKSVPELNPNHRAQLFNYMRITKQCRGILFNFGEIGLYTERYLYLPDSDDFVLLNQDNYRDYIDV